MTDTWDNEIALGSCGFGASIPEERCFELLDRFTGLGGRIVDTADNYSFWEAGTTGREAEEVIGRWLARAKPRDVVVATKLGAQPVGPGEWPANAEGLSAPAIRDAVHGSLKRLGVERLDVLYAHLEDRTVPLEETMGTFHELVTAGKVGRLGVSNHALWLVERAQRIAEANGWTAYEWLQYRHTYAQPRSGELGAARYQSIVREDMLDYVRSNEGLTLFAYSPMLFGAYAGRPVPDAYAHPGTDARLKVLREVAAEVAATPSQVVLAWMLGGSPAIVPVIGSSRVESLVENMAARDVRLSDGQRARLDAAR